MSKLTLLFYSNPRLLALSIGLILVSGLSSFYLLPRMEDPLLTPRVAIVNTLYPGADPERVESLVTEVIEEELREIEQIKELRSTSRANVSTITVELMDSVTDPQPIWSRVRDKVNDAAAKLPREALPPLFDSLKVRAYALIVALNWDSDQPVSYAVLRRLAEELEERLKTAPGTEKVDVFGEPAEEFLVTVEPEQLTSLGISIDQLMQQIRQSDAKVAAGQLRGERGEIQFEVSGELDTLARLSDTPIVFGSQQQSLRLGDIAEISKGIADPPESIAWIQGRRGIALGVLTRTDSRIDHWTERADTVLQQFQAELPSGIGLVEVFQQNRYVSERLANLLGNLILGGVAVVLVIFWLMGWRSALIVGAALPLSALMVMSGLRFMEIPIHQMSVTGLILALGLLIDNAIVMVDDVRERLREASAAQALSDSVRHLSGPLFGSTLTTALAFAPIALMPGPAGEFVGSIAVSVMLAIGSSLLLAMTVIPALTALLAPQDAAPGGGRPPATPARRKAFWRDGFSNQRLATVYRTMLGWLFHRPWRGLVLAALLPLMGFLVAPFLADQFFPPADRDQIQLEIELPPHASTAASLQAVQRARAILLQHPQVREAHFFVGSSAPSFYYNLIQNRRNSPRYSQALVQLRSPEGSRAVIHELQQRLDRDLPEARTLVLQLEQGPPFSAPIEVRLFGPDLERLRDLGQQVRAILQRTPGVIHTRAESSEALPKFVVDVNEEQTRLAGLTHQAIAEQMNAALDGEVGGSILEATELLPVRVRVGGAMRGSMQEIGSLDLKPAEPRLASDTQYVGVPLSALGEVRLAAETVSAAHFNSRRMNEVQAYVPAGVLPAVVLGNFEQQMRDADFRLPDGYSMQYGGEAAKRDDAVGNLMANVGVLMVLMVATLVLSFNSFRRAAIIGLVAVLSVGLGLASIWSFGYPFGFMAIVGLMGLIGVAINDSIVVLAALGEDPRAEAGDPDAIREIVMHSTRHVVATSLTTMAGFAPLVLAGGGFWPPLAVAIAGGVGGATLLALFFVPSAYLALVAKKHRAAA